MTDYIVQNSETKQLVSNYGSREWCLDVAALMNRKYRTTRYVVVDYTPTEHH